MKVSVSRPVMSYSLRPYGLQSTGLLGPWDSPGKNTGVRLPFPAPGDLPDPGIKPESPALQAVYDGQELEKERARLRA